MDKSDPSLHLIVPPFTVRLAQYAPDVPIPPTLFLTPLPFLSVTRSEGETTVLYGHNDPSYKLEGLPEPREVDGPYSVLRVNGPLVLTLTGILNELTKPLRDASVAVFAVSTWDTDYVLVPSSKLDAARDALTANGWVFD